MKVGQAKDEEVFRPFTITVESVEEARKLWHCLNISEATLKNYIEDRNPSCKKPTSFSTYPMFVPLDNYMVENNLM